MQRAAFTIAASVAFISLAVGGESLNYQATADRARWDWREETSHPLGCITQCGPKYDIALLSRKGNRMALGITVLLDGREAYEWPGHRYSVFRILDDTLYYANFSPGRTGGSVVAVDLRTGKQLWSEQLKALGPISHSVYENRMSLHVNREIVQVYGNESSGRYLEIKCTETGKTIGHKVFGKTERAKGVESKQGT